MIMEILQEPVIQCALVLSVLFVLTVWNYVKHYDCGLRVERAVGEIVIGNAQIIGRRQKQEDSFATAQTEYGTIAVVADGIGGLSNGKLASQLAVQAVVEEFQKGDSTANLDYFFQTAARKANHAVKHVFGDIPGGTTLMIVVIVRSVLYFGYTGDSMVGIYRNKRFIPLSIKQNVAAFLEKQYLAGEITRETAEEIPNQRRLMYYIGQDGFSNLEVEKRPILLKKKDRICVYTDGTETLTQIEMEQFLASQGHPDDVAHFMMDAIERKKIPYQDNATIILLDME